MKKTARLLLVTIIAFSAGALFGTVRIEVFFKDEIISCEQRESRYMSMLYRLGELPMQYPMCTEENSGYYNAQI